MGVTVVDADGVVKLFCEGQLGGEDLHLPLSGGAVGPVVVKAYLADSYRVAALQPDAQAVREVFGQGVVYLLGVYAHGGEDIGVQIREAHGGGAAEKPGAHVYDAAHAGEGKLLFQEPGPVAVEGAVIIVGVGVVYLQVLAGFHVSGPCCRRGYRRRISL